MATSVQRTWVSALQCVLALSLLLLWSVQAAPAVDTDEGSPSQQVPDIFTTTTNKNMELSSSEVAESLITSTPPTVSIPPTPPNEDAAPVITPTDDETGVKVDHRKPKSPMFLLYEVERDIQHLSLEDIEYALDLGAEIFSYSLADKLGYLEIKDDPHITVIEANKEKLMKKLESIKQKMTSPKPTTMAIPVPTTPAKTVESANSLLKTKIAYDVATRMHKLSLEAIEKLLNFDPEMGGLPYALSDELGYKADESDPYFQYLTSKTDSVLRGILEMEKKRKIEIGEGAKQSSKELSQNPISMESSKEPTKDITPSESTGNPDNSDKNIEIQPINGEENRDDTAGDVSDIAISPSSINGEENPDNGDDKSNIETPSINGEKEYTLKDEEFTESNEGEDPGEIDYELFDSLMTNQDFLDFLHQTEPEVYYELQEEEVDEDTLLEVLDEYREWVDVAMDETGGGGFSDSQFELEPWSEPEEEEELVGGANANGAEKEEEDRVEEVEVNVNVVEGGENASNSEEADDYEDDYTDDDESSSFGAWHILTIFIVMGVVVVVGYLCLHNRKRIREGVESYISDASKRRRRAREFKPLVNVPDDVQ